jgi:hypothetical protein
MPSAITVPVRVASPVTAGPTCTLVTTTHAGASLPVRLDVLLERAQPPDHRSDYR